jgi:DNA invertase Pin-like site-specific DNA recombinase
MLRKFCAAQTDAEVEIMEPVYHDENVSGSLDPIKRQGFQAMIQRVAQGTASIILCTKLDRFTRIASTWDVYTTALAAKGVTLECLELLKFKGMDRLSKAMVTGQVKQMCEVERIMISERTKAALDQKRARGEVFGKPPYGWKAVSTNKPVPKGKRAIRDLVPDEGEQATLVRIHDLYETDQESGIQGVRRQLESQAIPTRNGHCRWSYATIKAILERGLEYDPTVASVQKEESTLFGGT